MSALRIAVVVGSIRKESFNRQFAEALAHYARVSSGEHYIQARMRGAQARGHVFGLPEGERALAGGDANACSHGHNGRGGMVE